MKKKHPPKGRGASKSPYHEAADTLQKFWDTQSSSLKSLVYRNNVLIVSRTTYAIVSNVVRHQGTLEKLLSKIHIPARNQALLYILVLEVLSAKKINGGGSLKRAILQHQDPLEKEWASLTKNNNTIKRFPRYIRVNTVRTTTPAVIHTLQTNHIPVYADPHVPDLLVIAPQHTGRVVELFSGQEIILQDKSSCFSALCMVLADESINVRNWKHVLDACAAPGNKTSHLRALLGRSGPSCGTKITALDRDASRCQLLQQRMKDILGTECCNVRHADFLKQGPDDFDPPLDAILLDPSCSGSGLYNRNTNDNNNNNNESSDKNQQRIQTLSNFQTTMLKHALTSFPTVQRVVYSTCSLHELENEVVVAQALQGCSDDSWHILAPRYCLPTWTRRGMGTALSQSQLQSVLRVEADDCSNGFFVCCLQRQTPNETHNIQNPPFHNPNLDLDIPVYQNEFANDDDGAASLKQKQPSKPSPQPNQQQQSTTTQKEEKEEEESLQQPPVVLNKKRQKKMEWKRKQREQKLQRQKKQKVS